MVHQPHWKMTSTSVHPFTSRGAKLSHEVWSHCPTWLRRLEPRRWKPVEVGWLVGNLSPLFTEGFLLKSHGGFHPISEPSLVYTLKLPMLGKWIITFWNGPLLGAAMFVSFREGISFRLLCWAKDETSRWLSGFLVALPTNGTHFCRKMVGPYLRNNGCQRSLNKAGYCLGRVAWGGGGERHPLNFGNVLLNLLYCNEFCLKKRISYMMSWSMNSVPTC